MVIVTYLVRVFGGSNVFMILKQLRTPPGTSGVSTESEVQKLLHE